MIKRYLIGLTTVFVCFAAVLANAATHYVIPPGTAGADPLNPYTNWARAGTNIIDVVNCAMTNTESRTVWVSNGTYVLTNQIYITNGLSLQGFNGRSNTFIDGNRTAGNTNRCFYINNASAIVKGFTISNGGNTTADGGGVYCNNGKLDDCTIKLNIAGSGGGVLLVNGILTNCLITTNISHVVAWDAGGGGVFARNSTAAYFFNCDIISNSTSCHGGGIYLYESPPTIIRGCNISCNYAHMYYGGIMGTASTFIEMSDSVISNNYAQQLTGGVNLYGSGTISNCIICYNSAGGDGGAGGVVISSSLMKMYNCLIYSNNNATLYYTAEPGGGGMLATAGTIVNCTIAKNSGRWGASGLSCTGATENVKVINTIIYSNSFYDGTIKAAFTNCCLESTNDLNATSCTTNNPLFADYAGDNYHLNVNSPCVNAGLNQDWMTNAVDLDGRRRIRYGTVDMGAYETIYNGTIYKIGF